MQEMQALTQENSMRPSKFSPLTLLARPPLDHAHQWLVPARTLSHPRNPRRQPPPRRPRRPQHRRPRRPRHQGERTPIASPPPLPFAICHLQFPPATPFVPVREIRVSHPPAPTALAPSLTPPLSAPPARYTFSQPAKSSFHVQHSEARKRTSVGRLGK